MCVCQGYQESKKSNKCGWCSCPSSVHVSKHIFVHTKNRNKIGPQCLVHVACMSLHCVRFLSLHLFIPEHAMFSLIEKGVHASQMHATFNTNIATLSDHFVRGCKGECQNALCVQQVALWAVQLHFVGSTMWHCLYQERGNTTCCNISTCCKTNLTNIKLDLKLWN